MAQSPTITTDVEQEPRRTIARSKPGRSLGREWAAVRRHGMPAWKWFAMHAYYASTWPFRRRKIARAAAKGRAPIVVLLYHRVAGDWANEWTTHTDSFVAGVRWLKRHFELVSLSEAQRRVREGQNHRPCAAITFDDGYAENCQVALPLLAEERIPCTYFVATGHVLEGRPFDHDVKMGNDFPVNTIEELRHFADRGIEIGAHTRTHANIAALDSTEQLYDEIVAARDDLQDALGRRVGWFAFPFGSHRHLTAEAFHLANDWGFDGVVSAYGGYNFPGDDPFHLQRIGVDGPLIRLKNWSMFDPVKQLRMTRFEYEFESVRNEGGSKS